MRTCIGIDLGTSFCRVSTRMQSGDIEIIPNDDGERSTPTCIAFNDSQTLIGSTASNQSKRNPHNTVFHLPQLLAKTYDDPHVIMNRKHWPFKIISTTNKRIAVQVQYKGQTKVYFPEQLLAMLLIYLQNTAQQYLNQEVVDVVISVPVYFNCAQRIAVQSACTIAGLHLLRIVSSTSLAALTCAVELQEKITLIVDIGGGTVDASLINIDEGVIEVLASAGSMHLGGEYFDNRLVEYVVQQFEKKHNLDCSVSHRALRRIRMACERCKCTLSAAAKAYIEIDCLFNDMDFVLCVTRSIFEELCMDYFKQLIQCIDQIFVDLKDRNKSDVDEIIVIGPCRRIPKLRDMIRNYFDNKELSLCIQHFEHSVARGAALMAACLSGQDMMEDGDVLLLDAVSLCLILKHDIEKYTEDIRIFERNQTTPFKRLVEYEIKETSNKTKCRFEIYEEIPMNAEYIKYELKELNILFTDAILIIMEYVGPYYVYQAYGNIWLQLSKKQLAKVTIEVDVDADHDVCIKLSQMHSDVNCNGINLENHLRKNQNRTLSENQIVESITEAKWWKKEQKNHKEVLSAKNDLQYLVYETRDKLDKYKVNKGTHSDIQPIEAKMMEITEWLDTDTNYSIDECELHKNALNKLCVIIDIAHDINGKVWSFSV